jgi:Lipid A 3-O-deacylase (PagL)
VRNLQTTFANLRLLRYLLAILAVLSCSTAALSQDAPQPQPQTQPQTHTHPQPLYPPGNEFAVWGGYSVGNAEMIGIETNRQLGEFALRYGRTLFDKPQIALQYTLDVIPVETVRQYSYSVCMPTPNQIAYCTNGRETVYGGGVNPIGLKLNFRREHRFQPFIASTAGFVASVRPVPVDVPGGTQFNFTFDFQAGVDLFNSSRDRAWRFGYKYQHISNAYRHDFNPGVDFQFLFLSYSFFK